MKIGIDTRWIFPEISGIGSYTTELITHLAQTDKNNTYVLFFDHPEVMARIMDIPALAAAPNFEAREVPYSIFSPVGQIMMPRLLKQCGIELFHSTNYMIPFLAFPRHHAGSIRCVTTIHDLIPLLFPEMTPKAKKTRFHALFKQVICEAARRADVIIVPSRSSRADVVKHLHIPQERHEHVVIIQEGVNPKYQPAEHKNDSAPTLLYVGRRDPYKNLVTLVKAFALVLKTVPEARLRIIGPDDPRYPEAPETAKRLHLQDSITWTGYVEGDELLHAYQQADVFVLPSHYEGFGLPILEAMACGTPVICGNVSSQPEVAGDAAITIDPNDTEALAEAITCVLTDPVRASDLRAKGLARAQQLTWTQAAMETIAAYEQAMTV